MVDRGLGIDSLETLLEPAGALAATRRIEPIGEATSSRSEEATRLRPRPSFVGAVSESDGQSQGDPEQQNAHDASPRGRALRKGG